MAVKIILSDVDGTFLANDKSVPQLHAQALKSILDKGLKFAFVSARMPEAIYILTDNLKLPRTAVISYNGAFILSEDEKIIYDKKIPADEAKKILSEMSDCWDDISVSCYVGRKWFTQNIDERIEKEILNTDAFAEVANFDDLFNQNIIPNKIFVRCEPPTCEEMERELGNKFANLNVVRSAPHLLEVMEKSVSKATGIEILLKHYGFTKEEAIAFGDNYNDTEMLQYVPQSVAMGNSPEKIKKLAAAVTDTNEDSGIYTYLVENGVIEK